MVRASRVRHDHTALHSMRGRGWMLDCNGACTRHGGRAGVRGPRGGAATGRPPLGGESHGGPVKIAPAREQAAGALPARARARVGGPWASRADMRSSFLCRSKSQPPAGRGERGSAQCVLGGGGRGSLRGRREGQHTARGKRGRRRVARQGSRQNALPRGEAARPPPGGGPRARRRAPRAGAAAAARQLQRVRGPGSRGACSA
jgi:hypothetical protein